jgi:Ca2+-binding EF-hand superfamily protein
MWGSAGDGAEPTGNVTFTVTRARGEAKHVMGQHRKEGVDAEKVFRMFDLDGDGQITADELKSALAELGEDVTVEDAVERIGTGDTDDDGRISLAEFLVMMEG